MTKRLRYSEATKLAAVAAVERNGGNISATAREIGVNARTLAKWVQAKREGSVLRRIRHALPALDSATLGEQLEELARQMVTAMPEKLEEANLQELARSLTIVLDTLQQTRADREKTSYAREKLAEILERYAAARSAAGTDDPADGG